MEFDSAYIDNNKENTFQSLAQSNELKKSF